MIHESFGQVSEFFLEKDYSNMVIKHGGFLRIVVAYFGKVD